MAEADKPAEQKQSESDGARPEQAPRARRVESRDDSRDESPPEPRVGVVRRAFRHLGVNVGPDVYAAMLFLLGGLVGYTGVKIVPVLEDFVASKAFDRQAQIEATLHQQAILRDFANTIPRAQSLIGRMMRHVLWIEEHYMQLDAQHWSGAGYTEVVASLNDLQSELFDPGSLHHIAACQLAEVNFGPEVDAAVADLLHLFDLLTDVSFYTYHDQLDRLGAMRQDAATVLGAPATNAQDRVEARWRRDLDARLDECRAMQARIRDWEAMPPSREADAARQALSAEPLIIALEKALDIVYVECVTRIGAEIEQRSDRDTRHEGIKP